MKASTIKWIDYTIGNVVCRLLSLWNSLIPKTKITTETKKILFIKLIEQGANVLAYSSLQSAIQKVGKENVYFLVFEENKFILEFLNVLQPENIIIIRNKGFFTFTSDLIRSLIKIRKNKIDASIDMEFFSRASAIISYLSGAKKRVGLYRFTSEQPYRGNLITHRISYNPYIHVSKYYLLLVEALDEIPRQDPLLKTPIQNHRVVNPKMIVDDHIVERVEKKTSKQKAENRIVILNPNASDMLPLRKWETSKFENLANRILANYQDVNIVFTGIERERPAIELIIQKLDSTRCINLAGKTSLQELMALYQLSDLVITNDSGPAHFASMFDVQIIVLFGPETPSLFAPIGKNIHIVYKGLACSPCVNVFNHRFSPCTNNVCMQSITIDDVYQKVQEVL